MRAKNPKIFLFEFVLMDRKWYSYLSEDEFGDVQIRGKLLRAYIEENYDGEYFFEKYIEFKKDETDEFVKYAKERNIDIKWNNISDIEKLKYISSAMSAVDVEGLSAE